MSSHQEITKFPDWHWLADNFGFDNYTFGGLPDYTKWKYSIYIPNANTYLHLNVSSSQYTFF